jgi:hypothetical protein
MSYQPVQFSFLQPPCSEIGVVHPCTAEKREMETSLDPIQYRNSVSCELEDVFPRDATCTIVIALAAGLVQIEVKCRPVIRDKILSELRSS